MRTVVVGVEIVLLRVDRASQPVRTSSQPPAGRGRAPPPRPRGRRPRAGSRGRRRPRRTRRRPPRADQAAGRHRRHVVTVRPVTQCLGASKWVPVCSPVRKLFQYQAGPAVVVRADLLQLELRGLPELLGQLEGRRARAERGGEVDDLDGMEELVRRFEPRIAIAALGASAVAIAVARLFLGSHRLTFNVPKLATQPAAAVLPLFLVLGLVAGILAYIYNVYAARLCWRWRTG